MSTITVHPDTYYEDASILAIENALEEAEGLLLEDVRFMIRRAYPFSLPRSGRPYKIWSKHILEVEARLGIEQRAHGNSESETSEAEDDPMINREEKSDVNWKANQQSNSGSQRRSTKQVEFVPPPTKEELVKLYPMPTTAETAGSFLRRHCRAQITMFMDHDVFRAVLKQHDASSAEVKFEYKAELETDDQKLWNTHYIEAAQKLHKVWLTTELEKY